MKAAQITAYGGSEVVRVTETDKPEIADDQILVRVYAAGINPIDIKARDGAVRQMAELKLPATLGGDLAGTVEAVGSATKGFVVGQAVYGQAGTLSGHGSFAEFAPVKLTHLAQKPSKTDFIQAGSLPLVSVSAYQALIDVMDLKQGQKILIHGGSGGIGSMAIQIAKQIGAYVATTVSESSVEFVKGLGADLVIDYQNEKFEDIVKDFDAVFDNVGGEINSRSYQVVKQGGFIVSMLMPETMGLSQKAGITYVRMQSHVTTARLDAISKLLDDGTLHATIDKVFPLEKASEAMEYAKTSHLKGKVVIQIASD